QAGSGGPGRDSAGWASPVSAELCSAWTGEDARPSTHSAWTGEDARPSTHTSGASGHNAASPALLAC
ncbi:MAG: hypothetical protein ABSD64_07345, partial [Terriglobales bacterium]